MASHGKSFEGSNRIARAAASLLAAVLSACATVTTADVASTPATRDVVTLQVEACTDRTHAEGRDLGAEATQVITRRLGAMPEFRLQPDGAYRLTCEVEGFVPGSALKRWIAPGWGQTNVQVAVMLQDRETGATALVLRGQTTVSAGGLYTIGADTYVLDAAIADIAGKMEAWARGQPIGTAA